MSGIAESLEPMLTDFVGPLPLRLRAWDGSEVGPPDAPVVLVVRSPRALRRLLWSPNELGLGRAYVAGELDIDGDLFAALALPDMLPRRPEMTLRAAGRLRLVLTALRLGAVGPRPAPPPEEAAVSGSRHSQRRDAAAVAHHYDVGNEFYRLVLGSSMVYSCAFWPTPPGPTFTLADAQEAKCSLVARKLGLRAGQRLLDVGCGWGTMVLHAAREYGVEAVGVTVSAEQAELARQRVAAAGLADRVEIRLQDYREVSDGPFDAISSIGMAEHVGAAQTSAYAARLASLLRPEGRLLHHAISRRPGPHPITENSFLQRYVFPDGELLPVAETVGALEDAGLEVRDVQSLREHYALTLRQWIGNLEANWDTAVRVTSEGRARVWRLYMAAAAVAFDSGRIGVNQTVAVRPGVRGTSGMPLTRAQWLVPPARSVGETAAAAPPHPAPRLNSDACADQRRGPA